MQEFWKSYQIESYKVYDAKMKMKNELNAWKKKRGALYDQTDFQKKLIQLDLKRVFDLKAWKEKRGTHFNQIDLQKKINECLKKKE